MHLVKTNYSLVKTNYIFLPAVYPSKFHIYRLERGGNVVLWEKEKERAFEAHIAKYVIHYIT